MIYIRFTWPREKQILFLHNSELYLEEHVRICLPGGPWSLAFLTETKNKNKNGQKDKIITLLFHETCYILYTGTSLGKKTKTLMG